MKPNPRKPTNSTQPKLPNPSQPNTAAHSLPLLPAAQPASYSFTQPSSTNLCSARPAPSSLQAAASLSLRPRALAHGPHLPRAPARANPASLTSCGTSSQHPLAQSISPPLTARARSSAASPSLPFSLQRHTASEIAGETAGDPLPQARTPRSPASPL